MTEVTIAGVDIAKNDSVPRRLENYPGHSPGKRGHYQCHRGSVFSYSTLTKYSKSGLFDCAFAVLWPLGMSFSSDAALPDSGL